MIGYADDYICEADTIIIGRKGSIKLIQFMLQSLFGMLILHSDVSVKKRFCVTKIFVLFL